MPVTAMPEVINIDSLYIAKITADTQDAYMTSAPEYFAPVAELKHDPKSDVAISYYDGKPMYSYPYEGEAEESVTISGLTEQKLAELTAKSVDTAHGVIFDNGDPVYSPYYALGYHIQVGGGVDKYRWFYKGSFVPSSETYKTKGSKVDPQSMSLTYKPLSTVHQWAIADPRDAGKTITTGLKVARADTTMAAFTSAANWFSQVQLPGTIGAPTALSLSSSVPADDATGVLASTHPTLTFSNAIASDDVLLIKTSDNSIVPITKSYDTTGKVLTIVPVSNLTASGAYQIVIAGVKDIFGQALAAQVVNFTVAS